MVPTLSKNEANLCENVQGVSRRVRVFSRGRGQSERRLHGGEDSVHADVSVYTKDGEKLDEEVQGLDVGKLRRILTKDLGCRASEEEEKEEKENAKIIAQPGPGTIKDKKTN